MQEHSASMHRRRGWTAPLLWLVVVTYTFCDGLGESVERIRGHRNSLDAWMSDTVLHSLFANYCDYWCRIQKFVDLSLLISVHLLLRIAF